MKIENLEEADLLIELGYNPSHVYAYMVNEISIGSWVAYQLFYQRMRRIYGPAADSLGMGV